MAKLRVVYRCSECAAAHPKWTGQCNICECVEHPGRGRRGSEPRRRAAQHRCSGGHRSPTSPSRPAPRRRPVCAELDRVLGGGVVAGSVTLLGGEPGIGKSTLLLQLLAAWPGRTLYVSAEESAQQVRLRAERLGALSPDLWLLPETAMPHIVAAIDEVRPTPGRRRQHPDRRRPRARLGARQHRAGARLRGTPRARGEEPWPPDRDGRARHQGRRARRPADARARRRRRAQLRGRPSPLAAPAARGEEPVRAHVRARPVRDGRARASSACPTRASCSSPTGAPVSPARPSSRRSRVTGRCSSRCRRSPTPPRPARRRGAARRASTSGRLALLLAVLDRRAHVTHRHARGVRVGGRRRPARRAGSRPRRCASPSSVRSSIARCRPTSWCSARSASPARSARSRTRTRRLSEAARLGFGTRDRPGQLAERRATGSSSLPRVHGGRGAGGGRCGPVRP